MGCSSSKDTEDGVVMKAGEKGTRNPSLHGNLVHNENRKVDDVYAMGSQLGHGSATQIVQAESKKYTKTKRTAGGYAIKLYDGKSEIPPDLGKEAAILLECDHPNVSTIETMLFLS